MKRASRWFHYTDVLFVFFHKVSEGGYSYFSSVEVGEMKEGP
jgi:hypothetical protein